MRFVIVDLDRSRSAAQQALVKKYYRGYIPHLTVIGRDGKVLYNAAGEVEESLLSVTLKSALK